MKYFGGKSCQATYPHGFSLLIVLRFISLSARLEDSGFDRQIGNSFGGPADGGLKAKSNPPVWMPFTYETDRHY